MQNSQDEQWQLNNTVNQKQDQNNEKVTEQTNGIRIGWFLIKKDSPEYIIKRVKDLHKSHSYQILSKTWGRINMQEICPYIVQWTYNNIIELFCNEQPRLYEQMKHIKFENLKYMNTWGNRIESIQCLITIYWPNLQKICLWDNKITSLTPFRRLNAPKLNWLDLKTNLILDHSCLSQFYNPSKKFTRIHTSSQSNNAFLFKMQMNQSWDVQNQNKSGNKACKLIKNFQAKLIINDFNGYHT